MNEQTSNKNVDAKINNLIIFLFSEQFASLLAAGGSLLSVILVLVFIPYVPRQKVVEKSETKPESVLNISKIFGLIFAPGVTMLLLIKLVCGIPIGIIQSMFSVIAIEQFGMPADQVIIHIFIQNPFISCT